MLVHRKRPRIVLGLLIPTSKSWMERDTASVNYFTLEHNVITQTGVRPAPSESSSLIMGPPSSHTNIIATLLSLKFCPRFALSRLVANYVEIFRPEDIYF